MATNITTTVNALSGSSTPWSAAHRPLSALFLGLKENTQRTVIDPDATLTTLTLWERSNDGTLGRFSLFELEERAGFVTDDLNLLDGPEA